MDKCVRIIVAVAVWSQLTTGRKYLGIQDPYQGYNHGYGHVDSDHWHESPDWDSHKEHYHPRSVNHGQDSKNREYWQKHHPADWESDRWPSFPKGTDRWDDQDSPNTWNNQGQLGWGNQGAADAWDNQGAPNNWNNQGSPNGWNNQGGQNSWNNGGGFGNWNNPSTPNNWNDQGGSNGWNNQNRPSTWNQGQPNNGNNQNGNNNWNNQGRPTRAPAVQSTTQSSTVLETALCIRQCPVTSEYNPVCGSNNVTYGNPGRLECAKYCGVDVTVRRNSPCPSNTTQSVVTTNPIKDVEPTRFTSIEAPTPPTPGTPDFTISPDILSSIFTTTEDENVDIDIRTRSRILPRFEHPVHT